MNKLSNFFRPISLILIITFFSNSVGYTKELPISNAAPNCGEWKIESANSSNDQRLGVKLINQATGDDCSGMFTLENKTGTSLGGGYTLALNDISNNASVLYLPFGDKFLIPGLKSDIVTTPIDKTKQASVTLQGEVTLLSYLAVDLSFFVFKSIVDLIPLPTGCLISYDQILLISFRTAPILENTVRLISSGNLNGAVDEFSKVINVFFEKAGDYAIDSGISCYADFLKTGIGKKPVVIGKIIVSFITWWLPVVIFNYFKYKFMPVKVNLSYVVPEMPQQAVSKKCEIAFVSNRDGSDGIYVMNSDGSNVRKLTQNIETGQFHVWSPDGNKIAFESIVDNTFTEVYVVNTDGSNIQQLSKNTSSINVTPAWSPDGRRITFVSIHGSNTVDIFVMNADGTGFKNLTNNSLEDSSPTWSPDGGRITFISYRDGNSEIYVMNADGSNVQRLTNNPASDSSPTWSPDGSKIAFTSDRDGKNHDEIYVMNSNGSGVQRLTNNNNSSYYFFPAWSPDGNKIAFVSRVGNDFEVYMMNADGTGIQDLTNNPAIDSSPAWSPDGRKIAFMSNRDGNYEIYIMNVDGSNAQRLTNNLANDEEPAWSPACK